jgi:hypothetical protein
MPGISRPVNWIGIARGLKPANAGHDDDVVAREIAWDISRNDDGVAYIPESLNDVRAAAITFPAISD